jgi:hypothetical protein
VSRCKFWNPLGIFSSIQIPQSCTLVTYGLHILDVPVGFQNFVMHFLDEVLFQAVAHIDDLFLLGDVHVALDILSSCVAHQPFYLIYIIFFFFLFVSFGGF